MNGALFLVWSHVLLIWSIGAYMVRDPLDDDSYRTSRQWQIGLLARAILAAALGGFLSVSVPIAALLFISIVLLSIARSRIPARYCVELELGTNVLLIAISLLLVNRGQLKLERTLLALPVTNDRIAALCIVSALFLFTVHGGTYLVRGLLKKSGAVPMVASVEGERKIDTKEFNRGRLIGALERVLLFAVVVAGSYEALGFIVAAKGLVRSREFEGNRDMTEYFLIGSLASVLVALTTGTLARYLLATYR